jgi:ribosomal protein S18 acetylase RimI-like enzyme
MPTRLRAYEPADRAAVAEQFEEFQAGFVTMDPLGRTRCEPGFGEAALAEVERLVETAGSLFTLAEDEDGIQGFVVATVHRTTPLQELEGPAETWGRIDEVYVRPSSRGRGLGRELMEHAEEFLRTAGCASVRVSVFAPNVIVHAYYRGLGYTDRDVDLIKLID